VNTTLTNDGEVRVPYVPREEFLAFHRRKTRFACMVAHRRAGKTVACVNELIGRAIYYRKKGSDGKLLLRPRYAYIGPLLKQAKKTAWEYLKYYTQGLTSKKPSESELYVRLKHNDAEIGIYGADNPDAFRGQYFDGVVLDEYGDMSPSLWGAVILPTLADRRGWAAFIGTFKGRNHFYRIHRRAQGLDLTEEEARANGMTLAQFEEYVRKTWYHFLLSIDNSKILSEEEKMLQRSNMEEEEWEQEYRCNPNAVVKGTYYAKIISQMEQEGRINRLDISWDPEFPVDVYSDLGIGDSTALWFIQRRPDGYAVIDYHEAHGQPLSYYMNLFREKPYAYGTIWLPHDAKARTLQTGRSTVELLLAEDKENPLRRLDRTATGPIFDVVPRLDVQDGINAVRKILPDCWFSPATMDGVETLRAYKRHWDEDKKVFSDRPAHDWASHGSDAFRQFAVVAKGLNNVRAEREERPRIVIASPQIQLETLFQERERRLRLVRGRL
jgi:phage terminase large subunit